MTLLGGPVAVGVGGARPTDFHGAGRRRCLDLGLGHGSARDGPANVIATGYVFVESASASETIDGHGWCDGECCCFPIHLLFAAGRDQIHHGCGCGCAILSATST